MRTPLTVATGVLLVAGVVVGATAARAPADDVTSVRPIHVDTPAVPAVPVPAADPTGPQPVAPAAPQDTPRDPNGYVAPPPASDDHDHDHDHDHDDDDDDGFVGADDD